MCSFVASAVGTEDASEPSELLQWATRATRYFIHNPHTTRFSANPQEIVLSSNASALGVARKMPFTRHINGRDRGDLDSLMQCLDAFIVTHKDALRETAVSELPERKFSVRPIKIPWVTPRSITSICSSLELLAGSDGPLPLNSHCPSRALVHHLIEVCEDKQILEAAKGTLLRILDIYNDKDTASQGSGTKENRFDGYRGAGDVVELPAIPHGSSSGLSAFSPLHATPNLVSTITQTSDRPSLSNPNATSAAHITPRSVARDDLEACEGSAEPDDGKVDCSDV